MYKAGFLGLIGQPNAGKSSLMNFLISEKISIVTHKPQTTRRRILGLFSDPTGQVVFVDAPGIIKSTSGLNMFLQKEAEDVIKSSDALCAVLSLTEETAEHNEEIIKMVARSKKPWIAVINKVDVQDKVHRILILKEYLKDYNVPVFTVSAKNQNKDEKNEILKACINVLPETEAPLYDPELFTTENVRFLAEEIVREKCFEIFEYEIPYQTAVQVRKFDEDAKPCPKIYMDIIVSKDSHKPIVVGKAGSNIKRIGEESRKEIQKMMDIPQVYLELNVVVKDNWYENKTTLKDLKYVVNNE